MMYSPHNNSCRERMLRLHCNGALVDYKITLFFYQKTRKMYTITFFTLVICLQINKKEICFSPKYCFHEF